MDDFPFFAKPDLMAARRVLCIQPHYDDADIAAGGTLAVLAKAGAQIAYLTVTNDMLGVLDTGLTVDQAAAQLHREQKEAGAFIGVSEHIWLDFPDGGPIDYHSLRLGLIKAIRAFSPDFLLAPDPWMPYEAHRDHIITGQAAAESVLMYALPRMATDPAVDAAYQPHEIMGIAFYFTHAPNTIVDITRTHKAKHQALDCYKAQFTPEDMQGLHMLLEFKEQDLGQKEGVKFAEGFKALAPQQLHCNVDAWGM